MNFNNKNNVICDNFYEKSSELQKNIPHYDILTYLSPHNCHNNILPYALDRQISDFLSAYYNIKLNSKEDLSLAINKWQYEAIIYNLRYAQQNSLAYKDNLSHISCNELLNNMYEKYNNAIYPNDITLSINKLFREIDFTVGQSLLDNSEHFLAVQHDLVAGLISVETSGTSALANTVWQSTAEDLQKSIGRKKRIFCTAYDLTSTINFFFYGMQYILGKSNNKVALLMSGARKGSIGHLLYEAMQLLGISCEVMGFPVDENITIDALLKYEPNCIIGVPSHILSISYNKRAQLLKSALNCILLSGDFLTHITRKVIANNFACQVFEHYGLTETGFGCAVECGEHCGMHIRQLDLYVEIIDNNMNIVPDGQWGEVVITTLMRQAMPLIRYRTGDEGRLSINNCPCGSILKKLEVKGRINQCIALNSKKSIHYMELEEFIYSYSWISNFELCIFSGDEGNSPCLLIGLKLNKNAPENALTLISGELELQYKMPSLNYKFKMGTENETKIFTKPDPRNSEHLTVIARMYDNKKICENTTFLICTLNDYLQLTEHYNCVQNNFAGVNCLAETYVQSTKKYIRHINGLVPKI